MNAATYLLRYKTANQIADEQGVPNDNIPFYSPWSYQVFRLPWSEPALHVIGVERLPENTIAQVMRVSSRGLQARFVWYEYCLCRYFENGGLAWVSTGRRT